MNWLRDFWANPLVQIGAWVGGLLLSAFFGYVVARVAEKTRKLTYHVNPARAVIVKAGEASALEVSHEGRPVTTDVSTVQVQLWNQGRESIRQAHMLQPLIFSTADQTPILEATVRQQTRSDIVHLHLDDSAKQSGRIKVSWNILEHRDGGIIQFIIAGNPDVQVKAEAVIEGQRHMHEVAPRRRRVIETLLFTVGQGLVLIAVGISLWIIRGGVATSGDKPTWGFALLFGLFGLTSLRFILPTLLSRRLLPRPPLTGGVSD